MKRKIFKAKIITLKLITDVIFLFISFILAYIIKFKLKHVFLLLNIQYGRIYEHAQVEPYIRLVLIAIPFWIITFYFFGLYISRKGILAEVDETVKVLKSVLFALLEVTVITYLLPGFPASRYVLIYFGVISFIILSISRILIHKIEVIERTRGRGNIKTLIVGSEDLGQTIGIRMISTPNYGYHLAGFVDDNEPSQIQYNLQENFKHLGYIKDLEGIVINNDIEAIFIAKSDFPREKLTQLSVFCEDKEIKLFFISDYLTILSDNLNVEDFDGLPLISLKENKFTFPSKLCKRTFDLTIGFILLIILSPLFLLSYVLLKLESPKSPVLFRQERIGKDDEKFLLYKFRSMLHRESKAKPALTKSEDDERITKIGAFLRRTSLDELPQLINVINGDMSLVGPRPEQPFFVKKYEDKIPTFRERHRIKGGMTGWAQINGRSALTTRPEEKLKYDLYYIENWTLLLDIKIIVKTVFQVLSFKQAI